MSRRIITAAGRQIETVCIEGPNDRPVLVFLHEGLGCIDLWKDVPNQIASRARCPAIVYSRYGNGRSEVLAEARPVTYMHEEAFGALPQVLEAFGVHDCVLIGHSDGASIALIYAGERPGKVRAVVAKAPHVFVEELSVSSIARAKFAYESGDLRRRMARYHREPDRTFYGWNDVWLHSDFRTWNIRESVRGIRAPLFLIQGTLDEYGTIAQLEAIREDAAETRVDTLYLDGCGHAPHRDRPGMTIAAIAAFVESLLANG